MQLITILTIAVAILTILSGISTLFGTKRQDRSNGIWFFFAAIGLAIWAISISSFLSLGVGEIEKARFLIVGIISGITLADMGFVGYCGWKYKLGKVLFVFLMLCGIFVISILALHPEVFYSSISLNNICNQMEVVKGWYYYLLMGYYGTNTFTFLGFLLYQIKKSVNKNAKKGLKIFYCGLSVSGVLCLLFDLVFLSTLPQAIWVGPMAISLAMISYYYSVVRYRILSLSTAWMKFLSYIILAVAGVIVYLLVFYLVFMALFRIPNPSSAILLLNLLMAGIILCLVPAIIEIFSFMTSMVSMKEINVGYVVKKLKKITKKNVELKELAGFLADHLHFEYVGFLINGRLYGSGTLDISSNELVEISKLSSSPRGIWQEANAAVSKTLLNTDVKYVAELYNSKDRAFGQILIGRSCGKKNLERRDLIEIEMVINLVASIIDGEKK